MDSFLENIELKRKVIVDYEFMSFLIEKANNDDTNAITFIDYISNPEVDVYDFFGNIFDIRALQFMQDENKDNEIIKKETVKPNLSIANCFTILAFKDDIEANLLVLTYKNFKTKWETLSKCKSISINKGERFNSITDFWDKILENYTHINYRFLIVQEPYYKFNDSIIEILKKKKKENWRLDNKGINIFSIKTLLRNEKNYILCRTDKSKFILGEKDNKNFIKFNKKSNLHDRFFLTNYFYFRSGNSFDYFRTDKNEVQLSTSLIVTSIVNDFGSFVNFKNYYENIKQ